MIQPKVKIDKKKKEARKEKIVMGFMYLVLAFAVLVLLFTAKTMLFPKDSAVEFTENSAMQTSTMSSMSLTSYDKELAKKFMDKNNDGKCDACGMPVETCMDSGQLQCNMDQKSKIGILESQHIHADWKVYINGKALDFSDKAHMDRMKSNLPVSSFIHVDSGGSAPEKTGDVLHMHATGVPLWIFFESVGMKFENDCLTLDTGEKYCNDDKNTLKFYVNGKSNDEYGDYVFNDLDEILISYGLKNEDVHGQLDSITNFREVH